MVPLGVPQIIPKKSQPLIQLWIKYLGSPEHGGEVRRGSHVLEGARVNTAHLNSPTTLVRNACKRILVCPLYTWGQIIPDELWVGAGGRNWKTACLGKRKAKVSASKLWLILVPSFLTVPKTMFASWCHCAFDESSSVKPIIMRERMSIEGRNGIYCSVKLKQLRVTQLPTSDSQLTSLHLFVPRKTWPLPCAGHKEKKKRKKPRNLECWLCHPRGTELGP